MSFRKHTSSPVCQNLQSRVYECYLSNRNQILNCAAEVRAFSTCVERARQVSCQVRCIGEICNWIFYMCITYCKHLPHPGGVVVVVVMGCVCVWGDCKLCHRWEQVKREIIFVSCVAVLRPVDVSPEDKKSVMSSEWCWLDRAEYKQADIFTSSNLAEGTRWQSSWRKSV